LISRLAVLGVFVFVAAAAAYGLAVGSDKFIGTGNE
jgi:hypothetical protein